jgi:hypothetical protein
VPSFTLLAQHRRHSRADNGGDHLGAGYAHRALRFAQRYTHTGRRIDEAAIDIVPIYRYRPYLLSNIGVKANFSETMSRVSARKPEADYRGE